MIYPMWSFEDGAASRGYKYIAGVDEAGRGPLAGPVVSAAVILPRNFSCQGLADSKQLTPLRREKFYSIIMDSAVASGIAIATSEEIEQINILQASLLSMKRAVKNLSLSNKLLSNNSSFPDYLLIDGIFKIDSGTIAQETIVHGDMRSISIAAASILAKVTRDNIMRELHLQYPCYGFDRHKGYPTKMHKEAIAIYGPSPVHRKTFKGCSLLK